MGASPVLQLYRMLRLRSSRDVSMGFFAVVVLGQFTWVAYGLALHNLAVVLSNGCGMLVNAAVFLAAAILRRPARSHVNSPAQAVIASPSDSQ